MNRGLLYRIAGLTGMNLLARAIFADRLLILSYHGVCGERPDIADPDGLHVPAALFERQVDLLTRHYRPVSLAQVRDHFFSGTELPRGAVLITFDDGYRNVARHALPILARKNVPCVLFPVAGLVDEGKWLWTSELEWRRGGDPDFHRLRTQLKAMTAEARREWMAREFREGSAYPQCEHTLMNWREIGEVRNASSVEIGSHGLNHDPLTGCDARRLEQELSGSRNLLRERAGIDADAVAYPNGNFSEAVVAAAERAGYRLGFTTESRHVRKGDKPLALPRILVGRPDSPPILAARLAGWREWLGSN
jgi:peptidoglycan/xylan/chitin deacetylase (PgdA/CDA1 family)